MAGNSITGSGTLVSLGGVSKSIVLAEEEDKLRVQFTTAAQVYKGQPVKLTNTGTITPWLTSDAEHLCIGYCDADTAAAALVTIVCRGYALHFGIVAGAVNPGIATPNGYDSTDTDTYQGAIGYTIWQAGTTQANTLGWIIDVASAEYNLVRVIIKD